MPNRTLAKNQTARESKRQTKTTAGTKKFYANQDAGRKRVTCILARIFAKKRQADFGDLANQPKPTPTKLRQPIKTKENQDASQKL